MQVNSLSLLLSHSLFKLLSHVSSLRLPSGHSGPVLTPTNASHSSLFSPHFLVMDASVWDTFLLGVAFRHVICGSYLFFLPGRMPSEIQKTSPRTANESISCCLETSSIKSPSTGQTSVLHSFVLSFIFCPTSFQRQWAAFLGA